jgi:hypothetical protein
MGKVISCKKGYLKQKVYILLKVQNIHGMLVKSEEFSEIQQMENSWVKDCH